MFKVIPTSRILQLVIVSASILFYTSIFLFFFRAEPVCTTPSWSTPPSLHSCAFLAFFHLGQLVISSTSLHICVMLVITAVYWEQDRQGFRFDRSSSVNAVKSNPFTSGNPIRKPFKTLYTVKLYFIQSLYNCAGFFIQSYALRLVITWKRCTMRTLVSPRSDSYMKMMEMFVISLRGRNSVGS